MIGIWRSLEIAFFKWLAMPHPISLVHKHVVHMYGDPNIIGGVCDLVVDIVLNEKIIGFHVAILDIVYAGNIH